MKEVKILQKALNFASEAHSGQVRKYTGEPYINHCISVAMMVDRLQLSSTEIVCAAYLHDTVEDCGVTIKEIKDNFGSTVAQYVEELTDVFTKEFYPNLNRKERKRLEALRISKISAEAKTIKLADLIDNTSSIVKHDKEFSKVYLREKEALIPLLVGGSPELYNMAIHTLKSSIYLIYAN